MLKKMNKYIVGFLVALLVSGSLIGVAFASGLISLNWDKGEEDLNRVTYVLNYLDNQLVQEKETVNLKQGEIDTLTAEKTTLEIEAEKLKADKTLLNKKIASLESQIEAIKDAIGGDENPGNNGLPGKIKALQAEIVKLIGEKEEIQTKLDTANKTITDLEAKIDKLTTDLETANATIITLTSEKATLKASNTQLEADKTELTNSKTELEAEVSRLQGELQRALNDADATRTLADEIYLNHSGTTE